MRAGIMYGYYKCLLNIHFQNHWHFKYNLSFATRQIISFYIYAWQRLAKKSKFWRLEMHNAISPTWVKFEYEKNMLGESSLVRDELINKQNK